MGATVARGYCNPHYRRAKSGRPLLPLGPRPVRAHPSDPTLALVELTQGHFAVISAVDALVVGERNWWAESRDGTFYGRSAVPGTKRQEYLHRFVGSRMGLLAELEVDHENGNGLDCRRSNLRQANSSQNKCNQRLRRDSRLGIKGVHYVESRRKFEALLRVGGRLAAHGYFDTAEEAAAFVASERERLHGEFANHGARGLH